MRYTVIRRLEDYGYFYIADSTVSLYEVDDPVPMSLQRAKYVANYWGGEVVVYNS